MLVPNFLDRKILLGFFLCRLPVEKPAIIKLFVDSMMSDNNDAQKRQGIEPTHKHRKGF